MSNERRLAAIFFSDMKGYSARMGADEIGAMKVLEAHNAIMDEQVGHHEGRVIKTIGDAYMVLFQSSVAAVACALDCQRAIAEHNKGGEEDMQIGLRIGVHAGDVILTDDDAFGEAVNVAARLEPQAPVGGVCITEAVYLQVRRKVHATGTDLGSVQLKNLPEKLRLFALMPDAEHLDLATQEVSVAAEPDAAQQDGDATGGLLQHVIPYKNSPALIAYYCGVFAIIPCFLIGLAGLWLGIIGLKAARSNPAVKGQAHAWIGIVLGGLFGLIYLAGTLFVLWDIVGPGVRGH